MSKKEYYALMSAIALKELWVLRLLWCWIRHSS